ncbi:MAG: zeta toxin family protein [Burkholderiaceae bacterium]
MAQEQRPRLIVVAGPNGSGKTSITESLLRHQWFEGCEYINPDLIARDEFGDWNSPDAVLKAAKLADERREKCLADLRSLAFETVFSAPDKVDYLHRAKAAGFFIRMFFIGTSSPAINAARIAQRVLEGGHEVPISKIISRYSKSIINCAAVARDIDRLYVYDNSLDGTEPQLVFRASEGQLAKKYIDCPDWATQILNAVNT